MIRVACRMARMCSMMTSSDVVRGVFVSRGTHARNVVAGPSREA